MTAKRARVLLVEDESIIALEVRSQLEELGHDVVKVARKGEDAVSLASSTHPDLMLIDITLAGRMDGIEAARIIRKAGPMRIVFLTANADEATRYRALSLSPEGFLLKPYTEEELKCAVEDALVSPY